jgi:exodeoxyribonuclease-3
VKIASFNVNSLRVRLKIILDWLEKESSDVVCLQETKVPDNAFPKKEFEEKGFHIVFSGEKTFNGVAVLSKDPFQEVSYGFEDGSESTRLIFTKIKGIHIINTYVPQGVHAFSDKFREKLDWLQRLYYHVKEHYKPTMPVIWTGDFNIAPEPNDVYNPQLLQGHVGFNPDEHAVLQRFKEWGFIDVFRSHNSQDGHYTFWEYTIKDAVRKGLGWRIDHIWATHVLAERSTRCWIDRGPRLLKKPSDHTPIIAEFDIS